MSRETKSASIRIEDRFVIAKDVIARRNQDGTVILMKTDESSLFFKIGGFAAKIWSELEQPWIGSELLSQLTALFPEFAEELGRDVPAFLAELQKRQLLSVGENSPASSTASKLKMSRGPSGPPYVFDGVKEFDLDQIETEVLSDSVYLDVFAGSDLRLKKNILPIQKALEKIAQLEGVTFEWDADRTPPNWGRQGSVQAGLLAQQVASVMPELVKSDGSTGYLAMDYSKLTAYLVEAVKELRELADHQEKRIRELESLRSNA